MLGAWLKGAVEGPQLLETVARSVPLVGMALAAAVPLRAGIVHPRCRRATSFSAGVALPSLLSTSPGACGAAFADGTAESGVGVGVCLYGVLCGFG